MSHSSPPLLEVRDLTKRFQGIVSVNRLSFALAPGEILAVIGPNGAGKTTLVGMISGTLRPDAGTLYFEGTSIGHLPAFRRARLGIGRTFQTMRPFPGLSVCDNVMVGALFGRGSGDQSVGAARAQADNTLDLVGLAARADRQADNLSAPERKRLELARALAVRPKLILLDEVMAGLTATEVDEIVGLVRQIRNRGVTVLIVEHIMKAVRNLADRVIVLHHGERLAEGSVDSVFADPQVIDAYLGKRRT